MSVVTALLLASRHPRSQVAFRWLPIPLWCYGLPMLLRTVAWLPVTHGSYGWITTWVLPVALGLLLLGVDVKAVWRVGSHALLAMVLGAVGILLGGLLMLWIFHDRLPAEAWKGIGTLAATWTGGSLNMLAVRAVLEVPDAVFAPLVVVDALIAYSWMACLIAGQSVAGVLNHWLRASEVQVADDSRSGTASGRSLSRMLQCVGFALILTLACRGLANVLPLGGLVTSTTGWTILLVTTACLGCSTLPLIRQCGLHGEAVGYPCLYLVLAVLGAQANLQALIATPVWILVGIGCVAVHAIVLLLGGRLLRLPVGLLATASQANVGGVVSAPLVGAVYHQALAPVGLILAFAGNAVGTYLGMLAAWMGRLLAA